MPTYFFHIRDSWGLVTDDEGMDFANLYQAEAEGYATARDLAAADPSLEQDQGRAHLPGGLIYPAQAATRRTN